MPISSPDHRSRIILIDGASSAGKSTIARRLQQRLPEPFWHYSIDHLRDAGVLPLERIRSGEFPWAGQREAFFDGFHHSLPALAGAGNHLIVEHIVETETWMATLVRLLEPFDVFFVGVICPVDELERRERARGDRHRGDARRDVETIPVHAYDLELDGTLDPDRNVERLLEAWRRRQPPSVFQQMAG